MPCIHKKFLLSLSNEGHANFHEEERSVGPVKSLSGVLYITVEEAWSYINQRCLFSIQFNYSLIQMKKKSIPKEQKKRTFTKLY